MRKMVKSFRYAIEGILQCLKTQRNFRIHMAAAGAVALISPYFALTRAEIAVLVFAIFLVMVTEMFNTSIEFLVDLKTRNRYKYAKHAKDVAAGAVALAALCSVGIGIAIFGRIDVLVSIFYDVINSPIKLLVAGGHAVLAILFIFKEEKQTDKDGKDGSDV